MKALEHNSLFLFFLAQGIRIKNRVTNAHCSDSNNITFY